MIKFTSAKIHTPVYSVHAPVPAPRNNIVSSDGTSEEFSDQEDFGEPINGIKFKEKKFNNNHEDFVDDYGDEVAEEYFDEEDEDEDIPDDWKDDGQVHIFRPCVRVDQPYDHLEESLVDSEDECANGGLWNEVIEEEDEEEAVEESPSVEELSHFKEFDIEAVERSMRQSSRFVEQKSTTTPSKYFDDFDSRQRNNLDSRGMKPAISVKDIAKLFENSKPDETRADRKECDMPQETTNLSKNAWKSMPNLGNDAINNRSQRQCQGAVIPRVDYLVCSKVPFKERRSLFEKLATLSKSKSVQSLQQPQSTMTTSEKKVPLPLVGAYSPKPKTPEPPSIKGILKNITSKMSPTRQKKQHHSEPIVAYRWEDESNGEIHTEQVNSNESPLYVVENGKEYPLVSIRQRRKLFELSKQGSVSENQSKKLSNLEQDGQRLVEPSCSQSTNTGSYPDKQLPQEKVKIANDARLFGANDAQLYGANGTRKTEEKVRKPKDKCPKNGKEASESLEEQPKKTSTNHSQKLIKSQNVPYILEEKEVLQSIKLVKNIKNMFLNKSS